MRKLDLCYGKYVDLIWTLFKLGYNCSKMSRLKSQIMVIPFNEAKFFRNTSNKTVVLTHFVIPPHFVIPDALCNPPCHTL